MLSQSSPNAVPQTGQQQTVFKNSTSVLPQHVLQKYENAVIDYIMAATSPCVLLVNHNSATLLKHSQMVATNFHQHVQSSGELSNSSTLPSPWCLAIS
jgi:hypothetical protein